MHRFKSFKGCADVVQIQVTSGHRDHSSEGLNTSSNYSLCPQNSHHFDTLYGFRLVVTVLAYSMTRLRITSIQKGGVLDGIALPFIGSFFLLFSCYEAEKPEKTLRRGDFISWNWEPGIVSHNVLCLDAVFHPNCLRFCLTWKHGVLQCVLWREVLKQRALVGTYSRSRGHVVPVFDRLSNLGCVADSLI